MAGRTRDEQATLQVVGAAIRDARVAAGMSQEDLALRAELDRTYIGGVERGERNLGVLNLVRIARSLDVLASALIRDVR